MPVLAFAAGLALLVVGADAVVRGGAALAERFGVRPIVVGMTVVSLGTSLPELAIGLRAVADDNGELAVGNIVGTNLVNTLLVLGLAALLRPIGFERRTLRFDLPAAVLASLLLLLLALDGSLSLGDGLWLTAYGAVFLAAVLRSSRSAPDAPPPPPTRRQPSASWATAALVVGLALIVVGAGWLVDGAGTIASDLGVSDAVIGLTVVAIGTSAPELVTTVVSTYRGDRAIALGNLMGSNVFNIALVLGPTVLVAPSPVPVPDEVLRGDLLLMVVAAVACVPTFWSRRGLSRLEGALFVGAYAVYITTLIATRT